MRDAIHGWRRLLRRRGLRPLSAGDAVTRTGHCLCGAVRFEAVGEPKWVEWCHCESCRRVTGSPVTAFAAYPKAAVTFPASTPASFISSPGVRRSFCGRCGSPVAYEGARWPDEIHLHLGLFDVPDLVPARHGCHEEMLPWLRLEPPAG